MLIPTKKVPTTTKISPAYNDFNIYEEMNLVKQGLSYEVFTKAYNGYKKLEKENKLSTVKRKLTIVDFSLSSNEKRIWVIDLTQRKLVYHNLVSHGRNSGNLMANQFSNQPGSYMSSLGFYVTGQTYFGKHGLSLRLNGMEKGFNDNAYDRAVVIHSADYVSEEFVKKVGRLGRSQGCPAIPEEGHEEFINQISGGTCLFLYYPDKAYEANSSYMAPELSALK